MKTVHAQTLAPSVNDWLANTRHPRILHIFDRACNLINEHEEVLSIVTPKIGNAPFNLVIEADVLFSDYLNLQSPVTCLASQIHLGGLTITTADAKLWNPCPNWDELHSKREDVLLQTYEIASSQTVLYAMTGMTNSPNSPVSSLSHTLITLDIPMAKHLTSQIAGLGIGLTPSGDDFLMGALYAAWIIHPQTKAKVLASEIANTAAQLTTSLSAAWLKSAGRGEVGMLWHNLFNSLILPVPDLESSVSQILSTGETSGADALTGFIGTLNSYVECET